MTGTRSISTSIGITTCDVCGRTLLRGEQAQIYLDGGARRSVCELCVSRALHEGWVREGTVPDYGTGARVDRRRSLLGRWRPRRERRPPVAERDLPPEGEPSPDPAPGPARAGRRPERRPRREPTPRPLSAAEPEPSRRNGGSRRPWPGREPRHVRAVPTSAQHRMSSAVDLYNDSEQPRTVAGIARSLGLPEVTVLAVQNTPAVQIVVAWELCWYRFEVDLSDEVPNVRVGAQGYELDELEPEQRRPNALADDAGVITLA